MLAKKVLYEIKKCTTIHLGKQRSAVTCIDLQQVILLKLFTEELNEIIILLKKLFSRLS